MSSGAARYHIAHLGNAVIHITWHQSWNRSQDLGVSCSIRFNYAGYLKHLLFLDTLLYSSTFQTLTQIKSILFTVGVLVIFFFFCKQIHKTKKSANNTEKELLPANNQSSLHTFFSSIYFFLVCNFIFSIVFFLIKRWL